MTDTLEHFTKGSIVVLICVAVILKFILSKRNEKTGKGIEETEHEVLRRRYLLVYGLGALGDWLQGPYVYRLYSLHNLKDEEINQLFVIGFASSCVFGPFSGALWDNYGRKLGILTYGLLYSACCVLTAHGSSFPVLIIGRVLGGLSTAILFSAFESWLVGASQAVNLGPRGLDAVFTQQTVLNSMLAVFSGLISQFLADYLSVETVFNMAAVVLILVTISALFLLDENHGKSDVTVLENLREGTSIVLSSWAISSLGVIQALFEGSMYAFVLMWTPSLSTEDSNIPHGLIFSALMLSVMVGSLVNDLIKPTLVTILTISACALSLVAFIEDPIVRFVLFGTFEACVGAFWPVMASLRSKYVPENARCAVLSIFRIPLNLIVIWLLLNSMSTSSIFGICGILLFISIIVRKSVTARVNTEN